MEFFEQHNGEIMILILTVLVMSTLLILVPRLLRARQHSLELQHQEHMRALEKGHDVPRRDERSLAAGRTATLVPMVTICAAGTVTCFLVAYKADNVLGITLAAWSVAGLVSLAAITGGVALMGRLAQIGEEQSDEVSEHPVER